jgi:nucleotide-binding universal stress UspA family protein
MATLTVDMPMAPTKATTLFKKLMVAYDFSPSADMALSYALDLAANQNSEIILVHVKSQDNCAIAGGQNLKGAPDVTPDLDNRLGLTVDQSRKPGIAISWQLKAGPIAEGLAEAVDELEPDVLFLGAYGNNRLDRKVLGTTAEWMLRMLPCPVVAIGPKTVKKNLDPTQAAKILCPIDFPEDVNDRLSIIARLAKALSADVELVHVVDVSHERSRPHNAVDTQFEFDLLVEHFQQEGVLAHSTLLYGPPERVITEYAQAVNANYIMFGLHHDGHSSSYIRKSLVAKTIKDAPCAVFTFAQRAVQKGCECTTMERNYQGISPTDIVDSQFGDKSPVHPASVYRVQPAKQVN